MSQLSPSASIIWAILSVFVSLPSDSELEYVYVLTMDCRNLLSYCITYSNSTVSRYDGSLNGARWFKAYSAPFAVPKMELKSYTRRLQENADLRILDKRAINAGVRHADVLFEEPIRIHPAARRCK